MGIRSKVLFILGTALLFLILCIYIVSNTIIGGNIKRLEINSTEQKVDKVKKLLALEYSYLNSTSADWAQWDDTYNFVKSRSADYIKTNLADSTLANLKLNVMIFIDSQGYIVYKKGYDLEQNEELEVPEDLIENIKTRKELMTHVNENSAISGILLLKEGPMMFSSRPITRTTEYQDIGGTLVIGKYLSNEKLTEFERLIDAKVDLKVVDNIEPDSNYGEAVKNISPKSPVFVLPLDKDTIAGYALINDAFGIAKIIMAIVMPRDVFNRERHNLQLFLLAIAISGITFFIVCAMLVQKFITSRLEQLNSFIQETSASKDISGYIQIKGEDEISDLAEATNNMLSEIRKVHNELKENEERLTLVLEGSNDGFWDWNVVSGDVYFSPKCFELLGYEVHEFVGDIEQWKQLVYREDLKRIVNGLNTVTQDVSELFNVEFRLISKRNELKWFHIKGKVVEQDESGAPVRMAGILSDIGERKRYEEEIKFLSFSDKLTGLRNRAYFEREFERLNSLSKVPFGIIMGDLNGLKIANDAFGHEEGDKLLCKMADILRKSCRNKDVIARWGGDEFAILLHNSDEAVCIEVCEKIKQNCNAINDCMVKPSIALGMAIKTNSLQEGEQLLKTAEERMYRNKLLENKSVRNSIISSLEQTLAERSFETEEHTKRMRNMCLKIGQSMGLNNEKLDQLVLSATLHDIGKIAIPDNILLKPSKLDEEEFTIMKSHSEIGYRIAMSSPELMHIAKSILCHHERFDGRGYPKGLKGDEIPLIARILTIVDSFDVMTHKRPYKDAMSKEEAVEELRRCSGTQFDPELVDIFLKLDNLYKSQ